MTDSVEPTQVNRNASIQCLKCGQYAHPEATVCPSCGHPFAPRTVSPDELSKSAAPRTMGPNDLSASDAAPKNLTAALPDEKAGAKLEFEAQANVILQFLPTGACVSLSLQKPMVLGRGLSPEPEKMLDLTDFQGLLYGISRQHCKLERRGTRLYVADLGSTNGTYLNNKRLPPFQDHAIAHGDRLVLGALHVVIMFSTSN
jgi:ribosomal protein L37E